MRRGGLCLLPDRHRPDPVHRRDRGEVLRAGTDADGQAIEIREVEFDDDVPPWLDLSDHDYTNPKIARTTTAIGGRFIVSSLEPVVGGPQGVLFCDLDGSGCAETFLEGDVVEDVSPSSVVLADATLYWTFNTAETRVRSVLAADCVEGSCPLAVASGSWEPPASDPPVTPRPSSLRTQVLNDTTRLW